MTVFVEYCLFCDAPNCHANWDEAEDDVKPNECRRLAREDGWTRQRNNETGKLEDLCPECTAAKKAGSEAYFERCFGRFGIEMVQQ